ncbi:MAG: peptidoglycan-binding domain-containing protein [Parcubacteria group bacterium]
MSKIARKLGVAFIGLATIASFSVPAFGQTTEELQAQINALLAQISALQAQLGGSTTGGSTSTYNFTRDLTVGSTGEDVRALQQYLNSKGFTVATSGAGSVGNESTYFGSLTKNALASFQAANGISPTAGYFGPITRAKIASLGGGTTGGGTTTPIGAPLTVSLASTTPAGTNVLAGSANNVVTRLTFTAGNDADATITGLTIKSFGTAALNAADIARVKIYDGTIQKGLTQIQVNGTSTFTFAPALVIPKGTSKTYDVVVDVAATGVATPSATVKMGIESASKIIGSSFGGTFPIVGNSNTIVAGGSIGTVTVTAGAPTPTNNTYVGAKDVVLGNFIVTAGTNEDVKVTQLNVAYGGGAGTASTITDTDVSNIRVKVDGVVTGTPANFATRRATIDLTNPVILTKGTSKVFQIIGDITSGAARIIELDNALNSINGLGITSGVGVTGGGVAGATARLGATSAITIGAGQLSISVSSSSPAGASAVVVRSITPQVLGVYDIRAVGEDMLVNTVTMTIGGDAAAAGSISNVGLYDETGALLSNQVTLAATDWDNTPTTQTFTMNWLIPANTTKKMYVKGTTNTITAPAAATVTSTLALVGGSSVVATGLSSSGIAGPNNVTSASVLALPAMTINATATYLAVGDNTTTAIDQNVIGPVSQVTLGYLKVTAQNEDQDYRRLQFTPVTSVGDLSTVASGVALFDGTTQVTNFVAPLTVATALVGSNCITATAGGGNVLAGDVCFAATDTLTPTTFGLNTPKSLRIVANLLTPAAENITTRLTVAATNLETLGKTSGVVASNANAIDLRTTSSLGTGGTYTTRSNVVEIVKDATSPSGNVRGTFTTHGIWKLTANGTANTVNIGRIVFTSRVGLPNVAGNLATVAMFRLYNVSTGQVIASQASQVDNVAGTVTFDGIVGTQLQLTRGVPQSIALQVTTTSTAVWPINTQLQWSVTSAANVSVGSYGAATDLAVATDTDFGAAILLPTHANTTGGILKTGVAGAAFVVGTDQLYLVGVAGSGTGVVTAGDTLLIPNAADIAAGRYAGRVMVAADPDVVAGTGIVVPTLAITNTGAVGKTGAAAAAGVYGTDGFYIKGAAASAATVEAGDIRGLGGGTILTGKDYSGAIGYGGTVWSIPADANTVTLP